ncbi:hypothetical protein [Scytonema sp. NUACC21]
MEDVLCNALKNRWCIVDATAIHTSDRLEHSDLTVEQQETVKPLVTYSQVLPENKK